MNHNNKISIFADCTSRGGIFQYTLRFIKAMSSYGYEFHVITFSPSSNKDKERWHNLSSSSDSLTTVDRSKDSGHRAKDIANAVIDNASTFYFPNNRKEPFLSIPAIHQAGIKVVVVAHSDHISYYENFIYYTNFIDGIISPSMLAHKRMSFMPALLGINNIYIPHYVPNTFNEIQKSYNENYDLVLVYHGRIMYEQKRIDQLVNIFLALKNINCPFKAKIIGDGSYVPELIKQLSNHDILSQVEVRQSMNMDLLIAELASGDVSLLTSTYEGFCYSIAESMMSGLVPVVFSNGVTEEYIVDGKSGFVAKWGDAKTVASYIYRLHLDRQLLKRMSCNSQAQALKLFGIENYKLMHKSFLETIAEKAVRRANCPYWCIRLNIKYEKLKKRFSEYIHDKKLY